MNVRSLRRTAVAVASLVLAACSASDLVDVGNEAKDVASDGTVKSYQGAVQLYQGGIGRMERALATYVAMTATFSDEFNAGNEYSYLIGLDSRNGVDSSDVSNVLFPMLSQARAQAQQAIGALSAYPGPSSRQYIGELYAFRGLSEVLLAELYCSGVPLTDTPYGKDFTYGAGLSTADLLAVAATHFDSALVYADSAEVTTLARVGKGRALLDAGDFAGAAAAVADVPTNGKYVFPYNANTGLNYNQVYFYSSAYQQVVTNNEGHNGFTWVTTPADPRVPVADSGGQWKQVKYTSQSASITAADGIEARLIQAEAQLRAHDYAGWMATLQTLATSGGVAGVPLPSDPGLVNGSDSARVSVQFAERARWLFLTGHRISDLRRLVRQYGRPQFNVFPNGLYSPAQFTYLIYGSAVNVAPPAAERQQNPKYTGCLDRNA